MERGRLTLIDEEITDSNMRKFGKRQNMSKSVYDK